MHNRLRAGLIATALLFISAFAPAAAANISPNASAPQAGTDTITISPQTINVAFGQTFTVDVRIEGATPVISCDVAIPFDTTYLTGNSITKSGKLDGYWIDQSDLPNGKILFGAGSSFGNQAVPPFTHATLSFTAGQKLGATHLNFDLANTTIAASSGNVMGGAVNGVVIVGPNVSLSRSADTVAGCTPVTVDIMLNSVTNAKSADVTVRFDPTKLAVVDQDTGTAGTQIAALSTFLKADTVTANTACNALEPSNPACDTQAEAGTIHYAASQAASPWATGSGAIARITFRPVGDGTSALDITGAALANSSGASIAHTETGSSLTATALGAPGISIAAYSASTARLSWGTVSGAQAYRIYRKPAPYTAPAEPATDSTAALYWDDTSALSTAGQQFFYNVKAACTDGSASPAASNQSAAFTFALVKGS